MAHGPRRLWKSHHWLRLLLLCAIVCAGCILAAVASSVQTHDGPVFTARPAESQVLPGSEIRVQVFASPGQTQPGAFLVSLAYDTQAFDYVELEQSKQMTGSDLFTHQSNPLRTVYTCDITQGGAPLLTGNILTYVFRTREDTKAGTYDFTVHANQVCDFNGNALPDSPPVSMRVSVLSQPDSPASGASAPQGASGAGSGAPSPRLTMLRPSEGALSPAFDPEQFQYEMSVPATCSEVFFTAAPQNAQVSTEISRYSLNAAGSDTLISATVKTVDGKAKTAYTIVVHRALAEGPAASSVLPKLTSLRVHAPENTGLTPAFDPDTLQYEVTVAASISEITFDYQATERAAVLVNRHTLRAAGSDTVVVLTVSFPDSQAKTAYRVIVHRLAAAGGASQKFSAAGAGAAGKTGSGKKAGGAKASSRKTPGLASAPGVLSGSGAGEAYIPENAGDVTAGKAPLALTNSDGAGSMDWLLAAVVLAAAAAMVVWLILHNRKNGPPGNADPHKNTEDPKRP